MPEVTYETLPLVASYSVFYADAANGQVEFTPHNTALIHVHGRLSAPGQLATPPKWLQWQNKCSQAVCQPTYTLDEICIEMNGILSCTKAPVFDVVGNVFPGVEEGYDSASNFADRAIMPRSL